MNMKKFAAAVAVAGLMVSGAAQAALVDRGGGMIYDTVLDVTWLQDANYAKTSGYDTDGRMDSLSAKTWAANLIFGGFSDWRLPSTAPIAANWKLATGYSDPTYDGTYDSGLNIVSQNSELSYMFYVNLGLKGLYSTSGNFQSNHGIFGNGTLNGTDFSSIGQKNIGLIHNLQAWTYWTGTPWENNTAQTWYFNQHTGEQSFDFSANVPFAWAVRDGDVTSTQGNGNNVPEPGSLALLGLGLAGLAGYRRRMTQR